MKLLRIEKCEEYPYKVIMERWLSGYEIRQGKKQGIYKRAGCDVTNRTFLAGDGVPIPDWCLLENTPETEGA